MPLISPNRQGFAPWEKLPDGNGITYLEKFKRDPGIDPIYLAKISYIDDAALQLVINTFQLVPHDPTKNLSSFADSLVDDRPEWFPLEGVTHVYVYPNADDEYASNLWVNAIEKTAILERSWW